MATSRRALESEEYVLLTTFHKTGEPVKTPVWVVLGADWLLVSTTGASGKVKRLRHTARIELTPCIARGTARAGAVTVTATALVHNDADALVETDAALLAKYGQNCRVFRAVERIRRTTDQSVALVITAA